MFFKPSFCSFIVNGTLVQTGQVQHGDGYYEIPFQHKVVDIKSYENYFVVLTQYGSLYIQGKNETLFNEQFSGDEMALIPVPKIYGCVVSFVCGKNFVAACTSNGKVWQWGRIEENMPYYALPTVVEELEGLYACWLGGGHKTLFIAALC
jgi:hypothetical protein